jgi:hypothetical protein
MEGITSYELFMYHEALSSCAIEGNKYAIEQLELWKTDINAFIVEYLKRREIDNAD